MAGKILTTTVSINGDIEASVQKAFSSMADKLGNVQKAATQASGATDKLTTVIEKQSDELEAAKKAYTDYILSGEKSRKKAKELKNNIKNLSSELDDNEESLEKAKKAASKLAGELDETGESAKDSSDGFTVMKAAAAELVAGGIQSLISSCVEAVKSIAGLAESTREYRELMVKLDTAFQTLGHTAKEGTDVYKDLYAVFGDEGRAVEAAQQIAALSKNQEEMAQMVDIATGVWARWGDSLPAEALMEAVNSTAKIGSVQGNLADALEWSGVNLDEFNETLAKTNSESDRSRYILRILDKLYGQAADDYRDNNKSIMDARRATSDYTDTMAKLGEIAEPITTKVQEGFTLILQKVIDLITQGDIEAFGEKIETAFGNFVDNIMPKIMSALEWLFNNTGLIKGIAIAIGALSTALGLLGVAFAVTTVMASPLIGPILGIVAAITALITIAVLAGDEIAAVFTKMTNWQWEHITKPILNFFSNLFVGLKDGIKNVVSFFGDCFKSLGGILKAPLNAVISLINGAIDGINSIGFDIPDWVPLIGGKKFRLDIPKLPTFATGGFTEGVSIAGEAGTEAVISFDKRYRTQNLSYWAQAGRMLGADGADYALGGTGSSHIDFGGVTFAPNISITGNANKESVMEAIEAEYPEFLDMLEEYLMQRSSIAYA